MNPQQQFSTLVDLLRYRAIHQAQQTAFIFLQDGEIEAEKLTYKELDRQARTIAAFLQSIADTGDRAILLYPSGLEFIAAFFGCLYAGIISVPVSLPKRNRRNKRLESIIKDTEAKLVLTTTSVMNETEKVFEENRVLANLHCITTNNFDGDRADDWQSPLINSNTLALLQYTSGSTGIPKGVMVSHGNVLHNSEYIKQAFNLSQSSVSVNWLPNFHDMGLIDGIIQPLYTGFLAVILSPVSFLQKPIRWLQAISNYQGTHCGCPNFGYDLCVSKTTSETRANLNLSSWVTAYCGAEPIRRETIENFTATFKSCGFQSQFFYPCYGMAEATLMISGGKVADRPIYTQVEAKALEKSRIVEVSIDAEKTKHLVGCGRARLDTKIEIVDPLTLKSCSEARVGEIWVSGQSVAQGYWNKPEATKETFQARLTNRKESFLRTGDLGFIKDGELFVTGRLKDLIIIRGQNHYPQDIEKTVDKSHPSLRPNCGAAFSVEVKGVEKLVVVQEVERTHLRKLDSDEVFKAIDRAVWLEHELAIETIVLLKPGRIPKTSSGKIQRSACQQQFLDGKLQNILATSSKRLVESEVKGIDFSLLYFSSNEAEFTDNKYQLLLEGAKFADRHDFHAVWIPERHFHAFGGLYPEPSVLGSALAMITERIRIRPGSVVLPLQNPVRVAEQWSVVDNLSKGRVDVSFAKGWNQNDFVLSPENYANRTQVMFDGIETVQKLWRGESVYLPNGSGEETEIRVYPLPKQSELPIWITCSGGKEAFIEAGAIGANILTALLAQTVEELAEKIALYRESRAKNGYDPNSGHVTLMLHTFVSSEIDFVRQQVRQPLINYLQSSVNLWQHSSKKTHELTESEPDELLNYAFERYFQTAALLGTPSSCLSMVDRLKQIGVNEIACLIDFGVDADSVISNLDYLDRLRKLANGISDRQIISEVKDRAIDPTEPDRYLTRSEKFSRPRADELIDWLRSYANERINSRSIDERRCIPPHIVLDFGNRGLFGLQVPPEYGGIGLSNEDTLRVVEQLGAIDQTLTLFVGNHNVLGVRPIMKYASKTVREQLLPQLATGREIAAYALTESGAGSNPRAISAKAIPNPNGGWLLKGAKIWSGSAAWSSVINIFVQHLDTNGQSIGISGFVVPQGVKGLRQGPEALTMGMRGMVQNAVFLDEVLVNSEQLLGEAGAGMKVAQDAMMHGRLVLAAGCVGGMKRCAQLTLRYSKRRLVSTGNLLNNPVTLVRLSDLTAAITALETLVFTIGELLDRGVTVPEEVYAACKTSGPEFFWQAADQLVQLLGGRGYIETNIASQILRDARVFRIFEGPTETLNMFLGSRIINKGEELYRFLCEELDAPEIAQWLKTSAEQIDEHFTSLKSSSFERYDVIRWAYVRTGELTTLAILLAAVCGANKRNASKSLDRALSWTKLQFEQKLKNILSGTPGELVASNADAITSQIFDYATKIGDLEQTSAGEDHKLDELLQCQTSEVKSQSESDPIVEFNTKKHENLSKNEEYKFLENNTNTIYTADYIQNLIKNRLAKTSNIDVDSIEGHRAFVEYGVDSVMAVELVQDLQECLQHPLEATLLWNFPTIESLSEYIVQTIQQTHEYESENNGSLQQNEIKKEDEIEGKI